MDNGTHEHRPASPAHDPAKPGLSLSALQRRRLLLRGVGKGGAVLAAAVPMQTFAANILKTRGPVERLCTLSGAGSILPSAAPRDLAYCSGQNAGWWAAASDTQWPINKNTQFKAKFGGASNTKFIDLMSGAAGSDSERTWARAYLNASVGFPATFPYSATEVVTMYQRGGNERTAAENFFRMYV